MALTPTDRRYNITISKERPKNLSGSLTFGQCTASDPTDPEPMLKVGEFACVLTGSWIVVEEEADQPSVVCVDKSAIIQIQKDGV
jgi:hypothetical protein